MSSVVLITGANRGIGLEFVRHYAAEGWSVLATARDPARADDLKAVAGTVEVLPLDVSDGASVATLARRLAGRPLDMLINNAGVYGPLEERLGSLDYDVWSEVLAVNTLGPMRVAEAMLGCLRAGRQRRIISLTSLMGSIGDNTSGGSIAYRSSKAALNAAMKCLAIALRPERFSVVVAHPGWVRTAMGGPAAPLEPSESVAALTRLIARLTPEDSGGFFNYDENPLPW